MSFTVITFGAAGVFSRFLTNQALRKPAFAEPLKILAAGAIGASLGFAFQSYDPVVLENFNKTAKKLGLEERKF